LNDIKDHVFFIGNNKVGTYPLQAIIEQLSNKEEKAQLINAFRKCCFDMFFDPQGVHVIEKMIICFEEDIIEYIYELVIENFIGLAFNPNGLCLAKKIIQYAKKDSTKLRIQQKILENTLILIQHSYGNYTIQSALSYWSLELNTPIINQLYGKLINFSIQKFSSNVIEKCFEIGGEMVI